MAKARVTGSLDRDEGRELTSSSADNGLGVPDLRRSGVMWLSGSKFQALGLIPTPHKMDNVVACL